MKYLDIHAKFIYVFFNISEVYFKTMDSYASGS
jgi:hypothetical protein